MDYRKFRDSVRKEMAERGMTQQQLADAIGVSASVLSRSLSGDRPIELTLREALIAELGEGIDCEEELLLYVSAPVNGFGGVLVNEHQSYVRQVVNDLRGAGVDVYWPGEHIDTQADYQPPDIAAEKNMPQLAKSDALLYIQLADLEAASGSHIELGIALGLGKKVTVLQKRGVALPFMLEGFGTVANKSDFLPEVRVCPVPGIKAARSFASDRSSDLFDSPNVALVNV